MPISEETRTSAADLVARGNWNKAEDVFLRWLDRHPNDLHVLCNYADAMFHKHNHGLAIHLYRYLLKTWVDMPEDVRVIAWANIGQSLLLERHDKEAEYAFQQALEINPNHAAVYNAMGACHINQANPDDVIKWCSKALELDPEMGAARWNRGIGYLEKGDWEHGWPDYMDGDRKTQQRSYEEGRQMRMWDGKRNRTVVVWGEQGIGDEIMFASCLADFIKNCKNPILDCHPRMEKTFKRSFPGIPIYGTRKSATIEWNKNHKIDSQIAIGSLPSLYRTRGKDFPGTPYLKADPERIAFYRAELEKIGKPPYVGVAWFGGEKKTRFDYRSIPLTQWGPIFKTGCTFVSIQYNKWGHKAEAESHKLTHWDHINNEDVDFEEKAALIMACDLTISVCQTLVHFSGALGKRCWCLTPSRPAWRYGLTRDRMAWYNSVRLIRQKEGDDWKPVMNQVGEELANFKEQYVQDHAARVDRPGRVHSMARGSYLSNAGAD